MSEWIKCGERLPEFKKRRFGGNSERAICWGDGWEDPREMRYVRNIYAKTEKGKAPRWEESHGCLAFSQPTHWMPLPAPPTE